MYRTGGSFQEFGASHRAEDLTVAGDDGGIIANLEARQLRGMTVEGVDGRIVTLVGIRPRVDLRRGRKRRGGGGRGGGGRGGRGGKGRGGGGRREEYRRGGGDVELEIMWSGS